MLKEAKIKKAKKPAFPFVVVLSFSFSSLFFFFFSDPV